MAQAQSFLEITKNQNKSDGFMFTPKKITKKQILTMVVIFFVCMAGALFIYKTAVKTAMLETETVFLQNEADSVVKLNPYREIKQDFSYSGEVVAFELTFTTYNKINDHGDIDIKVWDKSQDKQIAKASVSLNEISNESPTIFFLEKGLKLKSDKEYEIRIKPSNGFNQKNSLGIFYFSKGSNNKFINDVFTVGNQEVNGLIMLNLQRNFNNLKFLFIIITSIIILVSLLLYLLIIYKVKLSTIFIVVSFSLGLIYWILVPPLATFDEHVHIENTMFHVSAILENKECKKKEAFVYEEYDYKKLIKNGWQASPERYIQLENIFKKISTTEKKSIELTSSVLSPSYIYLPQIIGFSLGYSLKFNLLTSLFFAAICNLIFYTLIISLAIKITPIYKEVFFCIGLFPTTLNAAASLSYDTFINATSILFIAIIFYYRFCDVKLKWKDTIILAVILVILAPCKLVYGVLSLLIFLIPYSRYNSKKTMIITYIVIFSAMTIFLIIFQWKNIIKLVSHSQSAVNTLGPWGELSYSYGDILKKPGDIIKLLVNTILRDSGTIILKGVARIQYIEYPITISLLMLFCVFVLMFNTKEYKRLVLTRKDYVVTVFTIGILSGLIIYGAIAWTSLSSLTIMGIQGRYFVPLFPLVFFLVTNSIFEVKKTKRNRWLYLFYSLQIAGLAIIATNMLMRNYDSLVAW